MSLFKTYPDAPFFVGEPGMNPTEWVSPTEKLTDAERWAIRVGDADHIPGTDASQRLAAYRTMRQGILVDGLRPLQSPKIAYETFMEAAVSSARAAGKDVDVVALHEKALKVAEVGVRSYVPKFQEAARRELQQLRERGVEERYMSNFVAGPKKTSIAGFSGNSLGDYGFQEGVPKPPSNPNIWYTRYQSVDGSEYVFRAGETRPAGVTHNWNNIILHALSEIAKGGTPTAPLAAAGILLKGSDGREVCNFVKLLADSTQPQQDGELGGDVEVEVIMP